MIVELLVFDFCHDNRNLAVERLNRNKKSKREEKRMGVMKKASLIAHIPVVNRKLIPLKMEYFIFLGALGCAIPFRTVFAKQLGLSGAAVGAIFTIVPFTKIITNPLFGAILDYFKRFRITIIIILILVALSHVFIVLLSPITPGNNQHAIKVNFIRNCNDTFSKINIVENGVNVNLTIRNISCDFQCYLCQKDCKKEFKHLNISVNLQTMTYGAFKHGLEILESKTDTALSDFNPLSENGLLCNNHFLCLCNSSVNCTSEACFEHNQGGSLKTFAPINEFASSQFWSLLILIAVSSSTFAAVLFLMDAVCYEILNGHPDKYGQQRLWGTAGWGAGTLLGGYVNALATGNSSVANYTPCFYLLASLCIVNIIPVLLIKVENVKYSKNIFKDVSKLICNCRVLFYIIMVFLVGLLSGLIWNYQMWFMEEIGADPLLLGLSMTAECFLAELPCFIIAGRVIQKIGHNNCISITFLCFGLKYFCFAYMKDPWLSIPVGFFHGPTFGIFYASMTSFGKENAPPGTEATVQALLAVSFEGIGVAAGCLVGGLGFDILGSRATLLYAGIASFAFLIINVILHLLLKNQKKREVTTRRNSTANTLPDS